MPLLVAFTTTPREFRARTVAYTVVPMATEKFWSTSKLVPSPTSCQSRSSVLPGLVPSATSYQMSDLGSVKPFHLAL